MKKLTLLFAAFSLMAVSVSRAQNSNSATIGSSTQDKQSSVQSTDDVYKACTPAQMRSCSKNGANKACCAKPNHGSTGTLDQKPSDLTPSQSTSAGYHGSQSAYKKPVAATSTTSIQPTSDKKHGSSTIEVSGKKAVAAPVSSTNNNEISKRSSTASTLNSKPGSSSSSTVGTSGDKAGSGSSTTGGVKPVSTNSTLDNQKIKTAPAPVNNSATQAAGATK